MTTLFPHAYVLNVVAADHPGIVAAVTRAVSRRGGNIDACSQTVVGGYFTLIMVVSFAEAIAPATLAETVRGDPQSGFQVVARPFAPPVAKPARGAVERFVLTAFGKDKPGIVLRFTQFLAGKNINILDLYAERQGDDFIQIGQLEIPVALDLATLQTELEQIAQQENFTAKLQHENIFVATNQLRLPHPAER
jgi:glycine cleavage system transcriptional repressor